MNAPSYLTADEAAARLGVAKSTIYAYVSRGLIRSEAGEGRQRKYVEQDVQQLANGSARSSRRKKGERTLSVATSLSTVRNGKLVYRGRDACRLARSHSARTVTHFLWTGTLEEEASSGDRIAEEIRHLPDVMVMAPLLSGLKPIARMQSLLPIAQDGDVRAFDRTPEGRLRSARLVLLTLAMAVASTDREPQSQDVTHVLCSRWGLTSAAAYRTLQAALVVSMAHPPGVDAVAARSAAAMGASMYDATLAGLSVFHGTRVTGELDRVEALFREAGTAHRLPETIIERQARGDRVPGFGHPAFPDGDPRARLIHRMIQSHAGGSEGAAFAVAGEQAGQEQLSRMPSLPFALVALARALELPRHAAVAILAVARSVHWTAQAIEASEADRPLSIQPQYTGPSPTASAGDGPEAA